MVTIPFRIKREFIQLHPEYNFVFPHNFWENTWVGPSAECKDLSNCFGVPVRWKLCKSSGYFSDTQETAIMKKIDEMIARIPSDKPVILFPKIGNGDSRMHIFAPKCYKYLHDKLAAIAHPVKYDYYA